MDIVATFSTFFLKSLQEKIFLIRFKHSQFVEKELNVKITQQTANHSTDSHFTSGRESSIHLK